MFKSIHLIAILSWPFFYGCATSQQHTDTVLSKDHSDRAEQAEMRRLAQKTVQLDTTKIVREGSEKNFVAIRSDSALLTRRLDSRTFLAHDELYGIGRPHGPFKGSDRDLLEICRRTLARFDVPLEEIEEASVHQEFVQTGRLDPDGNLTDIGEPEKGRRLARFSRSIDGVPVFSSHAKIGLSEDGNVGFLELHWPEIPTAAVREAHRLQFKVKSGWRAPEQKGASPGVIEAGIVHSAPVGFFLDVYPAIRVIYMSDDRTLGRKLMLYFDRHGEPITMPRDVILPLEPKLQRGER